MCGRAGLNGIYYAATPSARPAAGLRPRPRWWCLSPGRKRWLGGGPTISPLSQRGLETFWLWTPRAGHSARTGPNRAPARRLGFDHREDARTPLPGQASRSRAPVGPVRRSTWAGGRERKRAVRMSAHEAVRSIFGNDKKTCTRLVSHKFNGNSYSFSAAAGGSSSILAVDCRHASV